MKTPSWAIVIGIILMLFGGCGLIKHGQSIMMPQIMDMQQGMMDAAVESIEDAELEEYAPVKEEDDYNAKMDSIIENGEPLPVALEDSSKEIEELIDYPSSRKSDLKRAKRVTEEMKEMFGLSEFNKKWIVRFGYIGMFICAIYLMAGAFLANRNVFAIKFVFGALALSIVFGLIQMLVLSSDSGSGFFGRLSAFGNMFGVILDVIVLIVFSVIDKKDYFKSNVPAPVESVKDDWENF